ncbi:helix-turn-helix transcriptional regulator [Photobacterium makurazakiensis]|uniref:AraC family transcriptional regulator n=1 Tax=Photobacterium makurazakiensis TaxID=2910234 RepID=UPI003D0C220D
MSNAILNTGIPHAAIVIPQSYPDSHIIDWHHHNFSQLVFACSGVMIVETHENLWVIPSQRAVWIPAGTLHKVSMHGHAEMRNFYVQAEYGNDKELPKQSFVLNVTPLMRELLLHLATIDLETADKHEVERLIKVVLDQLRSAHQITFYLPVATDTRLVTICEALIAAPSNHDSLNEWASRINTSSRTLSRLFRKELGMSFIDYRQQVRLFEALKQLAKGKSVTIVAMEAGFSSQSAFNRLFKRSFGVTPGNFFSQK